MKRIKVVGAGGIGSILLPTLCRFLNNCGEKTVVTIIDGDTYQSKNRTRQLFDRLGNKAEVSAQRLVAEFKNVTFKARAEYVTDESICICLKMMTLFSLALTITKPGCFYPIFAPTNLRMLFYSQGEIVSLMETYSYLLELKVKTSLCQ